MAENKNSVSYMKSYLGYALEFEKYVYIWTAAMNEANARKKQLYARRKQLETQSNSAKTQLASLSGAYERQRRQKENDAVRYQKKARSAKTTLIVIMLVLFAIGLAIGYAIRNESVIGVLTYPVMGFATMIIGSLFTGILPVFIGIMSSNKIKAKNAREEAERMASGGSQRRQEALLAAKENEAENNRRANETEEIVVSRRQEEIESALTSAKKQLMQIYAENVLPQKYQNLNAVATLYEYLETGRCSIIQGHGGIYDTYEVEKLHIAKLQQLMQMNETLSNIEDHQRYICQQMRQANQTLSSIHSSLGRIEKTNEEIARNTAISAVANQQTAAATNWMAWNAWANGY